MHVYVILFSHMNHILVHKTIACCSYYLVHMLVCVFHHFSLYILVHNIIETRVYVLIGELVCVFLQCSATMAFQYNSYVLVLLYLYSCFCL